jgi:hypothetical protein
MKAVRGQDDRTRERHARDGVWFPAGGENPAHGPAAGLDKAQGLPKGQIGGWTGLMISAPICREGRDCPNGWRCGP